MEEEVSVEELKAAIRKGTIACKINPVFVGSVLQEQGRAGAAGRRGRLHAVPGRHPRHQGHEPRHRRGRRASLRPEGPVQRALAFKIMTDPFVGKLTYLRVYSGPAGRRLLRAERHEGQEGAHRPSAADALEPARRHRRLRRGRHRRRRGPEGHLHRRHAVRRGRTRSSWSPWSSPTRLSTSPSSPRPRPSRTRWASPCRSWPRRTRRSACPPTMRPARPSSPAWASCTSRSSSTACCASSRSRRTWASRRSPTASVRATKSLNAEGKFVRQSGGRGQYGHAVINMYPQEPGKGYEFENKIVGGVVPKEYIPSIDKGIQEALNSGVLAGLPGRGRDASSSSTARTTTWTPPRRRSRWPAPWPSRTRCAKSNPVILEPVMAVEVETPEEYTGFVMGDIPSRRGLIQGQEQRGNAVVIQAKVPLGQMFGYATDLRSGTQGRAVVHHAVRLLRAGAEERGRRNYQQGRRQRLRRCVRQAYIGGKVSG